MMNNNLITAFDERDYEIKEQKGSSIVLAKKKIILPEVDKKDIEIVNIADKIITTGSMDMVHELFVEQNQLIKTR